MPYVHRLWFVKLPDIMASAHISLTITFNLFLPIGVFENHGASGLDGWLQVENIIVFSLSR